MINGLAGVTYITSNGTRHPLDLIEISNLNILQDLFTPHLYGEATITDRDFWETVFPTLGDKLEVIIEKPIMPKSIDEVLQKQESEFLTYTFDVYKSVQHPIDMIEKPYRSVCVYFTAGNMLNAYTTNLSRKFLQKSFKQIATQLLNTVNVPFNFNDSFNSKKIDYITPQWTPIKTLTDLSDYVVSDDDRAGILFYQDLDGILQFVTIPSLFEGKMGIYDNTKTYIPFLKKTVTENHSFNSTNMNFNKIETLQFTKVPNYFKMANKGFFNSNFKFFNMESNKIDNYDKSIKDTKNLGTKLSDFLNVNPDIIGKYNTNTTFFSPTNSYNDYFKGNMNTKLNRMLFDMYEINLNVAGYIDRKIGQLITVEVPAQLAPNRENEEWSTPDTVYTGTYLIRTIAHKFTSNKYIQEIVAVTDGINNNEKHKNIISWT